MVADGLFTRFPKPDYSFALHVGPGPYGYVSYKPGVWNSTSDGLEINFIGKGGHGSRPHVTVDPIMMAGRFIVDVQDVISREKDAAGFGVVTIGAVQASSAGSIIPDTALLRGAIRSHDDAARTRMIDGIERTAQGSGDDGRRAAAGNQDHRRRKGGGERCCARRARRARCSRRRTATRRG